MMQGTKAFCSGGDQALRTEDGYADYENIGRLNVLDLQVYWFILDLPIGIMVGLITCIPLRFQKQRSMCL